jgi:hypothetical protein
MTRPISASTRAVGVRRGILEVMTTSAAPRRHLASSPFKPAPEPIIEHYEVDDLVSHDSYGMGRVLHVDGAAVTVDFRSQTVRIPSPFHKMSKL